MRTCRNCHHGFTLIELLVVIAVIAILAAILFPVFAPVRERARMASCLSNVKQIGLAIGMYADDYEETLVPLSVRDRTANTWGLRFYTSLLEPYIKNLGVWKCPSNASAAVDIPQTPVYGGQNSYPVNAYVINDSRYFTAAVHMSQLAAPAETLYLVDGSYWCTLPRNPKRLVGNPSFDIHAPNWPRFWAFMGNPHPQWDKAPEADIIARGKTRHMEQLNTLFVDGHARSLPYIRVIDDLTLNPNNSFWDPYKQGVLPQ